MNMHRNTIIIDAGSAYTKAQVFTLDPEDTRRLSFSSVVKDFGTNPPDIPSLNDPFDGDGFVLRWNGRYWGVGNVAELAGGHEVRGGNRYTTDEWCVLIAAAMCALCDESQTINLNIATPLRGGEKASRTIQTTLRDVWRVKAFTPHTEHGNAGQRSLDVAQVSTISESEGGYYLYLFDEYGDPRNDAFYQGLNRHVVGGVQELFDSGLVLWDLGGWTVDALPVNGLHPNFDRAVTMRGDFGLNWVLRWFEDELQSHDVVGGGAAWRKHDLENAITPTYSATGKPSFKIKYGRRKVDVKYAVERAVEPLDAAIADWLMTALNGGRDNALVFLTGGGASAAHPWLAGAIKEAAERAGTENHCIVMAPDQSVPSFFHNVEGCARFLRRKAARRNGG